MSFGYRTVREINADGTVRTGDRSIDETQAAILRRVFTLYVGGMSPRAIARTFQTEGIRGPRDGHWTASLILGNAERETGVLRNHLYKGEMVWNRQHFRKHPATGKRIAEPNPRDQWIIKAVPALRIIDEDLWQAAQDRLQASRQSVLDRRDTLTAGGAHSLPSNSASADARLNRAHRPAWLLSGLVKCGICDGPMTVMGKERLGCANHHARHRCDNNRTMLRNVLLEQVLDGLKQSLLAPELVEHFVKVHIADVTVANQERNGRRAKLVSEQARIERQIKSILTIIRDTGGSRSLVADLHSLEGKLAAFLYLTEDPTTKARAISGAGLICSSVRSSLVAGARNHLYRTRLV